MKRPMREIMFNVEHDATPKPRIVGNNTVEYYRYGCRIIRLHNTDIATFSRDGRECKLDTGGWRTITTRYRINHYTPAHVRTDRGQWYIGDTPYTDGMVVRAN